MKQTVDAIMITLDVAGSQSLFILLTADGTINRLGNGAVDNWERDMFIGVTEEPLFEKLRERVNPEWFEHLGAYEVPDKTGKTCQLTVLMKHRDGTESGLQFRYGSESQGPPGDVCQFVTEAVALTEPWYRKRKQMVAESRKPWWKFW